MTEKLDGACATEERTWPGVADIDKPKLEQAHHSAIYWINGAREHEDKAEAVLCAEQAANVWKNAAVHFAQLANSVSAVSERVPTDDVGKRIIERIVRARDDFPVTSDKWIGVQRALMDARAEYNQAPPSAIAAPVVIGAPDVTYKLIEEAWQIFTGNNCKFSAGWVEPPQGPRGVDTVYLRFEKDGVTPTHFLLRPDELAAIAACASQIVARDCIDKADKA